MSENLTQWVAVPRSIKRDYVEKSGTLTFHFSVAPQNVPIGVRSYKDTNTYRYVIEFRYQGHEEREKTTIEDGIVISTGVSTGRLYTIEVPIRLAKAMKESGDKSHDLSALLSEKISEAMNRLRDDEHYTGKDVSSEYFRLTSDIVHDTRDELFAALA